MYPVTLGQARETHGLDAIGRTGTVILNSKQQFGNVVAVWRGKRVVWKGEGVLANVGR